MQQYSIEELWCGLISKIVQTTPRLISIDLVDMKKIDLRHKEKHYDKHAKVKVTVMKSPPSPADQDWYHMDECLWSNGLP